jgi:hypothetical protein
VGAREQVDHRQVDVENVRGGGVCGISTSAGLAFVSGRRAFHYIIYGQKKSHTNIFYKGAITLRDRRAFLAPIF